MVNAVYVHAPVNIDGKRMQNMDIFYNFIGTLPYYLKDEKTA